MPKATMGHCQTAHKQMLSSDVDQISTKITFSGELVHTLLHKYQSFQLASQLRKQELMKEE